MGKNGGESKSRAKLICLLLILVLFSATIYVIATEFDILSVITQITQSENRIYLLAAPLLMAVFFICYSVFMRMTSKSLGFELGRFRCLIYSFLDFFYTSATPGGCGGPAGMAVSMSSDGTPASFASAAVIIQTIVFRAVLILFGTVSGIMLWTGFIETEQSFRILFIVGATVSVVIAFAFMLSLFLTRFTKKLVMVFITIAAKLHIVRDKDATETKFLASLVNYRSAAQTLRKNKKLLLKLMLVTMIQRGALFSVSYLVYLSFGLAEHGFAYVFFLQTAVALAADSLPIPGGIGVNEYAFFMLYGRMYPTDDAAAAAMILTRAFCYYIPLILTSFVALIWHSVMGLRAKREQK